MTETSGKHDDEAVAFAHRLFDAVRVGDMAFVTSAVDQGAPVGLTDQNGNTLLMLAAYHGHEQLVAELALRHADVNQVNDRGQSPLAGAVFKKAEDVIRVLLRHGADLDHGTPSARETAAMFGVTLEQ